VAVGVFVFGRKHHTTPVRYRSIVTVRVAPKVDTTPGDAKKGNKNTTTTIQPINLVLSAPQKFALTPRLRINTLRRNHLTLKSGVNFGTKLDNTESLLSLVVTANTRAQALRVGRSWGFVFV